MTTTRTAEVAGSGIAGLAMATALAQRGWRVTVHERNADLREIGAGISLRENGLQALEALGAFEQATGDGEAIRHWELYDERNRVLSSATMDSNQRFFMVPRQHLHRCLVDAARAAGAEIRTDSVVVGADPGGTLVLAGGERRDADLVVGADGINSTVRESLGVKAKLTDLKYISRRALVPRLASDEAGAFPGYWRGNRRMAVSGCGPELMYAFMFCPPSDRSGYEGDYRPSWKRAFPEFASIIDRLPDESDSRSIREVRCERWSAGSAVLLGDAAYGMAPTMGQAACIAMSSAVSLARILDRDPGDVRGALAHWESVQRPVVDATQTYGRYYVWLMTRWPAPLLGLRSAFVKYVMQSRALQARLSGRPAEE